MNTTAIILAGGKSSRMGEDKGLIKFNGKSLVQYIIETLESMGLPIIIIANNSKYETFGYPVYSDIVKEKGPVGGIYTALCNTTTEKNILISCDAPFVSRGLIERLLGQSEHSQVTIPEFENKQYPLIGIYDKSTLDTFKNNLNLNQLKLRKVNESLNSAVVKFTRSDLVTGVEFENINTREELKAITL